MQLPPIISRPNSEHLGQPADIEISIRKTLRLGKFRIWRRGNLSLLALLDLEIAGISIDTDMPGAPKDTNKYVSVATASGR